MPRTIFTTDESTCGAVALRQNKAQCVYLRLIRSTDGVLCWPLTLLIISAARLSFPRDEEHTLLGLLGSVVNSPLTVSVPCCRERKRHTVQCVWLVSVFNLISADPHTHTHTLIQTQQVMISVAALSAPQGDLPRGFYSEGAAAWLAVVFGRQMCGQMWSSHLSFQQFRNTFLWQTISHWFLAKKQNVMLIWKTFSSNFSPHLKKSGFFHKDRASDQTQTNPSHVSRFRFLVEGMMKWVKYGESGLYSQQ